jgi:hypothetical protein
MSAPFNIARPHCVLRSFRPVVDSTIFSFRARDQLFGTLDQAATPRTAFRTPSKAESQRSSSSTHPFQPSPSSRSFISFPRPHLAITQDGHRNQSPQCEDPLEPRHGLLLLNTYVTPSPMPRLRDHTTLESERMLILTAIRFLGPRLQLRHSHSRRPRHTERSRNVTNCEHKLSPPSR